VPEVHFERDAWEKVVASVAPCAAICVRFWVWCGNLNALVISFAELAFLCHSYHCMGRGYMQEVCWSDEKRWHLLDFYALLACCACYEGFVHTGDK
jgi:hypothetical protein